MALDTGYRRQKQGISTHHRVSLFRVAICRWQLGLRLARQRLLGDSGGRVLRNAAAQQGLMQIVRDFCGHSNAVCEHCRFPKLVCDWSGRAAYLISSFRMDYSRIRRFFSSGDFCGGAG